MKLHLALPLFATALIVPAPAQAQSARDFQLPPAPTPTTTPEVQGPVDDSGVVPIAPRAIPTGEPTTAPAAPATQSAPILTPAPSPTPSQTPPASATTTTPTTRQATPSAVDRAANQPSVAPAPTTTASVNPTESAVTDESTTALPTAIPADPSAQSVSAEPDEPLQDGEGTWSWLLWIAGLLVVFAGAALFWRHRGSMASTAAGLATPTLSPRPTSSPSMPAIDDLRIEAEAVRVSRSVMNAMVAYRLVVSNRGGVPIANIVVGGDLTSAHSKAPIDQQVADPHQPLPQIHIIDRIAPGQRQVVSGEIRLPLNQVRLIHQGKVPVYIPLLRITLSGEGLETRAHTYVVGKQPAETGGRLRPFRLDTPPQSFGDVVARPVG